MYNRKFLLKCLLLVCVVLVALHEITKNGAPVIRELQQSGRNLAAIDPSAQNSEQQQVVVGPVEPLLIHKELLTKNDDLERKINVPSTAAASLSSSSLQTTSKLAPSSTIESKPKEKTVGERVREVTKCLDRPMISKTQQRGDYWVLYNYIKAEKQFKCHESITYTTHADYSFMDNLVPLLERWRGPVSIAIHAPGTDFNNTLESIAYLRECTETSLVRELVTFHVYFSTKHVPKWVPKHSNVFTEPYNCSQTPPYMNASTEQMYKTQKKLLYPVNVGRNVAREMAQTHYILPSDIELYPSPNIITKFLELIAENKGPLLSKNPKVFPLHIFEVSANQQVPETKTLLKEMLVNGSALPFHKKLCPSCHSVPKAKEWQNANETKGLHVFHVGKRNGKFIHWEPIFIGTHSDPLYDERLSWEGKSDKMTQGYALCVMNYDFLILDNAFLVHKPGIKKYKQDNRRAMLAAKTNQLIKKIIFPELKILYGVRKGCGV